MTTNFHTFERGLSSPVQSRGSVRAYTGLGRVLRQRYIRLELAFWCFAIPLLGESILLRRSLHLVYPMLRHLSWITRLPRPVLWIVTGLSLGFLIGFLGGVVLP